MLKNNTTILIFFKKNKEQSLKVFFLSIYNSTKLNLLPIYQSSTFEK